MNGSNTSTSTVPPPNADGQAMGPGQVPAQFQAQAQAQLQALQGQGQSPGQAMGGPSTSISGPTPFNLQLPGTPGGNNNAASDNNNNNNNNSNGTNVNQARARPPGLTSQQQQVLLNQQILIHNKYGADLLSEEEKKLPIMKQRHIAWVKYSQHTRLAKQNAANAAKAQGTQQGQAQAQGQVQGQGAGAAGAQANGNGNANVNGGSPGVGNGVAHGNANNARGGVSGSVVPTMSNGQGQMPAQQGQMPQGQGQLQMQMQGQGGAQMQQQPSQQYAQLQQNQQQGQGQGQAQMQMQTPGRAGTQGQGQGQAMGTIMARQPSSQQHQQQQQQQQQQPLQPPQSKIPSPLAQGQTPQTPRVQQSPSMGMGGQGMMPDANGQQQQQFPQNGFPNHVPTQTPTPGQMQAQTPQSKMNAMLDVQSRLTKQAAQAAQLSKSPQQPPPQLAGSPLVNQNQALANAAQAQAMNMNMNGNANALGRSPAMPSRGQGQLPPHMTPQMANMQLPQQQQQQMGQMQGQGVMQGQGGQMQGQGLPNAMQNLQRQQQQLPQHPHANISRQQNSASPNTTAANLYDNFATLWRKRQDGTLTDHEKSTFDWLMKHDAFQEHRKRLGAQDKIDVLQRMTGAQHAQGSLNLTNLPPAQAQALAQRLIQQRQQQQQQQMAAQGGNSGATQFQQGLAQMGNMHLLDQGQGQGQGQGQMPNHQGQGQVPRPNGMATQATREQQHLAEQAVQMQLAQAQKAAQMQPNGNAQQLLFQQQRLQQANELMQQSQQQGNFQALAQQQQALQMMREQQQQAPQQQQQQQQQDPRQGQGQGQRRLTSPESVLLANGIPAALIAGLQGYATMAAPLKAELQNSDPVKHAQMEKALALLRQNAQQQQRNNQQNMVTPGGTQRPMHPQFPLGGQAAQNVSNNLHIPVGRHRSINNGQQNGPGTPQSNGAGSAASPMRMPHMALASNGSNAGTPPAGNPQNQLVRNMINQGIPTVPNRANMNMQQQIDGRVKPEGFTNMASLAAADPNAVRRASLDRRMSSGIAPAQLAAGADAEKAALPVPTWEPDAEYDAKLMELLARPTQPERSSGRQTMGRLGIPRILEAVPLEAVPESLRSLLEETEDADKDEVDPSMPGSRKRRFQELADTVDRDLIIEHDVETVLLEIANEHADLVTQLSCNLAKHRGSDQVDRKDVQLAYELALNRPIPGFSSDQIRLDQAKSSSGKRITTNMARNAKLRLVSDAKAAWRKEKEEAKKQAEEASAHGMAIGNGDEIAGRIGVTA